MHFVIEAILTLASLYAMLRPVIASRKHMQERLEMRRCAQRADAISLEEEC